MLDLEALLVTLYAARTSDTGFSRGLVLSGVPVAYALVNALNEAAPPYLAVVLVEDERLEEARAGALRLLIDGVRTVLLVDPRQARAWYGHEGALSALLPGAVIEDASLSEPLPAEAVLCSDAARTWSGRRLYERTRRGLIRRWRHEKETEAA